MSGLSIKDGAEVESGGRRFIIMQLVGFDDVVARDIETDDLMRLDLVDLSPVSLAHSTMPSLPDLSKVDDCDWAETRRRLYLEGLLGEQLLPNAPGYPKLERVALDF